MDIGSFLDSPTGEVSVRDYADIWLEQRILRPRTVELYRGLLDHHILPHLGDLQVGQLRPMTIRSWHSGLAKADHPGAVTVAKAYRLLKTICVTAVSDGLISNNPCNIRGAGVERSGERPVLSVVQLKTIARAIEPRYRAMVLLAAWCALRLGELLALTRTDVDLCRGTVSVSKSAAELKNGKRIVGPPKTSAGVRTVAIPPHLTPVLDAHLREFCGPDPDDLLFTGTKGQPVRRASLYKAWHRAAQKAGVEGTRFHDLRHTGATLAASTGASTRELMARLGHVSSDAALRYQHATHERDQAIAKALSDLISDPTGGGTR